MVEVPQNCWVVAAGDGNRNYADICLEHGVVIMGPSYCGDWLNRWSQDGLKADEVLRRDKWSSHVIANLNSFVTDVKPGDLVILRLGTSEIHGVGIVAGEYDYNELFSDIDGWDLAHTHRVNWIWNKPQGKPKDANGILSRGYTLQRLKRSGKTEAFFKWVETLPPASGNLPDLKKPGKELDVHNIIRKLFDYGLGSGSLSALEDRIKDLCTLAEWYKTYGVAPSEYETTSHLITPLLLALGWTPQRIQLEYPIIGSRTRVDLALYQNGNRKAYEPIAFIEAKKFGYSCLNAESQIRNYAENMQYLRRLIVTDGIRYGIFVRKQGDDEFPDKPTAYLNLTDLRDEYPVYGDCRGADEALLYMSGVWSHRFEHPDTPVKNDGKV